jgi:hypothetical protein
MKRGEAARAEEDELRRQEDKLGVGVWHRKKVT